MNNVSSPFMLPDSAPELARRFAMILGGLAALVARRFLRMPHLMRFTVLLFSRLSRAAHRFHRLLTRPAGKVRAPQVRVDRERASRVGELALPRGRGWIVRDLGWEAAAFMGQLEALLAEAEARALVAGSPAAGRALRPICRMLGVAGPVETPVRAEPALFGVRLEPSGLAGIGGGCESIATS